VYDISEQKRRERANLFLDQVSRVLASSLDYEDTLKSLLQLCVPKLADFAVLQLQKEHHGIIFRFECAPDDETTHHLLEILERDHPIQLLGSHPMAVAMRTGMPQLRTHVTDAVLRLVADDDEQLELLRQLHVQSAVAAPLVVRGRTLGALLLVSQRPERRYERSELELAEALARRAALAIDNAELFQEVSQSEKRSRFLADAAQSLSASLDFEETIRRIVRLAVPGYADFTIAFLTDERGETEQVAVAHRDPEREVLLEKAGALYRPSPGNLASTVVRAVRSGEPVLIEEVTPGLVASFQFEPAVQELFDQLAPVSWISFPLTAGDVPMGAIVFAAAESGRRFGADDLALGQLLASRAALALKNARLYGAVQEALRTRDEVLAIVSHDLRSPLHTINMSAELLLNLPLEEEKRRHHLEVIAESGARMNRLIQDLLDVARIEAGKTITIEPRRERADQLIRDVCDSFIVEARGKGVQIEAVVAGDLPALHIDRDRIMQVLSNLISNALRFTPEGGRITVRAQPDRKEVCVSVADNGPGIRPEDRESIFLPFWQSLQAGRTSAGLGLTIARAIVEQHGGRIWVESPPGSGAEFKFTLPIVTAREASRAAD
jgi:signal transduction histidine kinase